MAMPTRSSQSRQEADVTVRGPQVRRASSGAELRQERRIAVFEHLTAAGPTIFEINPRFSSTVMFRDLLGFRDVLWSIDDLHGWSIPPFRAPVGARVYRVFTEVVSTDGTIVTG